MKVEERLKKKEYGALWQEYCGFLDLDVPQYMKIQNRLMEEQIALWSGSELGRTLLRGAAPKTVEEFRAVMPLTTYDKYAGVLLKKQAAKLPSDPVIWIQTTWEGGNNPVKLAPYSRAMLNVLKSNVISIMLLSSSSEKGRFSVRYNANTLYGLAPLPYVTGLFPLVLDEEVSLRFLPPVKDAVKMSFGERNKLGFQLGLSKGIDIFFGMSSVINYITESFVNKTAGGTGSLKSLLKLSPAMLPRYLAAAYRSRRDGVPVMPKDIFRLNALICAGTDTGSYKKSLEEYWGCKPLEVAAGTELTCIGTETWARDGLVFFPDSCFYEFLSEDEALKCSADSKYIPRTRLMDEVSAGAKYELVISVLKGGAFARYSIGDIYQCVGTGRSEGVELPRFRFVDRVPDVIDIAGFTRITEDTVADVVRLSGLPIKNWCAAKAFDERKRPYLHMYVEMEREAFEKSAVSGQILIDHLSVYFKYFDSDYNDLKRLLGIDPLRITVLRSGAMDACAGAVGAPMRRINPSEAHLDRLRSFRAIPENDVKEMRRA